MGYYVGVDLGGTNIVCGLINDQGELIRKLKRPTEVVQGSAAILDKIGNMAIELLRQHGAEKNELLAIGVGTPGFVDPLKGIAVFASNLGFSDLPFADELQKRVGVPVFIDNDVRMYVYGEASSGAAKGYENVLGITLGTGLAAAVINNGRLYYGGGFMAGEIGHIKLEGVNRVCGCGGVGCLESIASATGIARQARDRIAAGESSVMAEWFPPDKLHELTASDVSRAYDLGDPVGVDVMHYTGLQLGRGLSYAVTLYSPDVIVIGGGAALAGERLFAPMRDQIKRLVYKSYWERLTIKTAELIDDAGVIGSAMFARQRVSENN